MSHIFYVFMYVIKEVESQPSWGDFSPSLNLKLWQGQPHCSMYLGFGTEIQRSPNCKNQKQSRLLSNLLCPHLLFDFCVRHTGNFKCPL